MLEILREWKQMMVGFATADLKSDYLKLSVARILLSISFKTWSKIVAKILNTILERVDKEKEGTKFYDILVDKSGDSSRGHKSSEN